MNNVIFEKKLLPVAVIDHVENAKPLAEALFAGGLNVIEVTLRTEVALDAIVAIKASVPDMLIGAGTILDHTLIPQLIDRGVSFGITPGMNPRVIEAAHEHQLSLIPGIVTPSELEQARYDGFKLLKFFPAEAVGGVAMLKALVGPYGQTGIRFIPTGGITIDNMQRYISLPSVAAVGGSWFVAKQLLAEKRFEEITRLTEAALKLIPQS